MPHFIIDCSEELISQITPNQIMQKVYDSAASTNLFDDGDIKVRINPYKYYNNGNTKHNFIHIFSNILEGRTSSQKAHLSQSIVRVLNLLFPSVPIISINIREFDKISYCNKFML